MTKSASISLASLLLLLALAVVATFLSSQSLGRKPHDTPTTPPPSQVSAQKPVSLPSIAKDQTKTSPDRKSAPSPRAVTPENQAIARIHNPLQQELLKKRLLRDESLLTREQLADGTELIHLNGTQAHFSAAFISADGTVQTRCSNNFDGLINSPNQLAETEASHPSLTK